MRLHYLIVVGVIGRHGSNYIDVSSILHCWLERAHAHSSSSSALGGFSIRPRDSAPVSHQNPRGAISLKEVTRLLPVGPGGQPDFCQSRCAPGHLSTWPWGWGMTIYRRFWRRRTRYVVFIVQNIGTISCSMWGLYWNYQARRPIPLIVRSA